MALDTANRRQVWAHAMRSAFGPWAVNKTDLRAAVDAVDTWVDDNTASFNTAIPQPARGALTTLQKSALLCYVVMRRQGVLPVEGD